MWYIKSKPFIKTKNKSKERRSTTMTKIISSKSAEFEEAFRSLSLATWNRPRSSSELQSFVARREQRLSGVEL